MPRPRSVRAHPVLDAAGQGGDSELGVAEHREGEPRILVELISERALGLACSLAQRQLCRPRVVTPLSLQSPPSDLFEV